MPKGIPNPKPDPEVVGPLESEEIAVTLPPEFVTSAEFQEVNQWFVEQLAALSQRVDDLETLVAQPQGSVRFLDIDRQPAADDIPEYTPEHGGPGWYSPTRT